MDLDLQRKGKSAVIKTSTRQVAIPKGFLHARVIFWFILLDILHYQ